MIKCQVDETTNIKRRAAEAVKNAGKILLVVAGFTGGLGAIGWLAHVTQNWNGWLWIGGGLLAALGVLLLLLSYVFLHWLICKEEF